MFRLITPCLILVLGLSACKDRGNPIIPEEHFEAGPIVFVSDKSGTSQLYSMNEDGSDVKQLTHDPNFPITDARYSPDGTKIAFASNGNIWLMDSTGANLQQLTTVGVDASFGLPFSWSQTGDRIVYTRYRSDNWTYENGDLWIVQVQSKQTIQLTRNP